MNHHFIANQQVIRPSCPPGFSFPILNHLQCVPGNHNFGEQYGGCFFPQQYQQPLPRLCRVYTIDGFRYYQNCMGVTYVKNVYGPPRWLCFLQEGGPLLTPYNSFILDVCYGSYNGPDIDYVPEIGQTFPEVTQVLGNGSMVQNFAPRVLEQVFPNSSSFDNCLQHSDFLENPQRMQIDNDGVEFLTQDSSSSVSPTSTHNDYSMECIIDNDTHSEQPVSNISEINDELDSLFNALSVRTSNQGTFDNTTSNNSTKNMEEKCSLSAVQFDIPGNEVKQDNRLVTKLDSNNVGDASILPLSTKLPSTLMQTNQCQDASSLNKNDSVTVPYFNFDNTKTASFTPELTNLAESVSKNGFSQRHNCSSNENSDLPIRVIPRNSFQFTAEELTKLNPARESCDDKEGDNNQANGTRHGDLSPNFQSLPAHPKSFTSDFINDQENSQKSGLKVLSSPKLIKSVQELSKDPLNSQYPPCVKDSSKVDIKGCGKMTYSEAAKGYRAQPVLRFEPNTEDKYLLQHQRNYSEHEELSKETSYQNRENDQFREPKTTLSENENCDITILKSSHVNNDDYNNYSPSHFKSIHNPTITNDSLKDTQNHITGKGYADINKKPVSSTKNVNYNQGNICCRFLEAPAKIHTKGKHSVTNSDPKLKNQNVALKTQESPQMHNINYKTQCVTNSNVTPTIGLENPEGIKKEETSLPKNFGCDNISIEECEEAVEELDTTYVDKETITLSAGVEHKSQIGSRSEVIQQSPGTTKFNSQMISQDTNSKAYSGSSSSFPKTEAILTPTHSTQYKKEKGFFPFRKPGKKEVLNSLKEKLTGTHSRLEKTLKSEFPIENASRCPTSILYNLKVFSKIKGKIVKGTEIFGNNATRILVTAQPDFGKSTLCRILAYQWARHISSSLLKFAVCLHYTLKSMIIETDLSKFIVTECTMCLANKDIVEDLVRETLLDNGGKVLILLDGYDELSVNDQQEVNYFLESNVVFKKSTVLVTTRPGTEEHFNQLFDRHVHIGGFKEEQMKLAFKHSKAPKAEMESFFNTFKNDERLSYLSELSPLFSMYVWAVIDHRHYINIKEKTVFGLLDIVIDTLIRRNLPVTLPRVPLKDYDEYSLKLGKLFLQALACGRISFKEELLAKVLDKWFQLFKKCHILYEDRTSPKNMRSWIACSKIVMVYYATKYLRHLWKKLTTEEERKLFLRKELCFRDCTGDYVLRRDSGTPCLYFVGLLPEIILRIGNQCTLEHATLDMYYDLERIELSHAFDSVNVLVRIPPKKFGRFGFEELAVSSDAVNLQQIFAHIVNLLTFEDCNVDLNYYHNVIEDKYFLKITVSCCNDISLISVIRADMKGKIDKIYIDFSYENYESISQFLSAVLIKCLPGSKLSENEKVREYNELVYGIVGAVLNSNYVKPAIVSCGGNIQDGVGSFQRNMSFKITKNTGAIEDTVEIVNHAFSLSCCLIDTSFFKAKEFSNNKVEIMALIQECHTTFKIPKITIQLL